MSSTSIKTHSDKSGEHLTIAVNGVFNFDLIADFRNAYEKIQPPPKQVTVDLRDTISIDSAALGILLNMQEKLALGSDRVQIINAAEDVRRILEITHFDKKFQIV